MRSQIFEHSAHEVAHVDERNLGEIIKLLHRRLRHSAGRARNMLKASGASHIDAAMYGVDPGGAGIGYDDAGRAEN